MKKYLFYVLLLVTFQVHAQDSLTAFDLYSGSIGSTPSATTVFEDRLLFIGTHDLYYRCMYAMYMNYPASPFLMFYPPAPPQFNATPLQKNRKMAVYNNNLYFAADNANNGVELATRYPTGSTILPDINPGPASSNPDYLTAIDNKLYFQATEPGTGTELYIYDGNHFPAVHDINAGPAGSKPEGFTKFNNKVYFAAQTATAGTEFFCYDPARDTLWQVADINPGAAGSNPRGFIAHNGKLYFRAYHDVDGGGLYSYDGLTVSRITGINNSIGIGIANNLGFFNGQIYFAGSVGTTGVQLCSYNPATGVASFAAEIYPGRNANPMFFQTFRGKLYFTAQDAAHGQELWVYDGGTARIAADIYPGPTGSNISDFVVYGNLLCFAADNGTTGRELYSFQDLGATNISSGFTTGSFKIVPNPAIADARLEFSLSQAHNISIRLSNAFGSIIWQQPIKNYPAGEHKVALPIAGRPAGIYFYHIAGDHGQILATGQLSKL